jgi:hypothetical protein
VLYGGVSTAADRTVRFQLGTNVPGLAAGKRKNAVLEKIGARAGVITPADDLVRT